MKDRIRLDMVKGLNCLLFLALIRTYPLFIRPFCVKTLFRVLGV